LARRYRIRFYFFVPAGIAAAVVVGVVRSCSGPVTGDYRDPAVLARAVEQGAQQHGDGTPLSASCAQMVFPQYLCTVAFIGGTVATYNVTVASDGSWWHAQ
jgi:hypothetical protein